MADVQSIEIQVNVTGNAEEVFNGLNASLSNLQSSIGILNNKLDRGIGENFDIKNITTQLSELSRASQSLDFSNLRELKSLSSLKSYAGADVNIDKIISDLKRLNDVVKSLDFSKLRDLAILRRVSSNVDNISSSAKKCSSSLGKLFSSIKRIALYRAIRTALKVITNGIKEGISNAYQYDKALGGAFSQAMDSAATSALYLKNSLGAALAPVLMSLIPIFTAIVDVVAKAFNAVARFFAALRGDTEATQAKKVATVFAEANQSVEKTKDAVEELKDATTGFDELNVISDNKSSGGGGGASVSANSPQPEDMFETVKLDKTNDWAAKFGDKLKTISDKLGGIKNVALVIVGIFAAWKLTTFIADLIRAKKLITTMQNVKGVSVNFTGFFDRLGDASIILAFFGGLAIVLPKITAFLEFLNDSGMSFGDVALGISSALLPLVGAFAAMLGVLKLFKPSWEAVVGAAVILAGLALVLTSISLLIQTISDSGMSLTEIITGLSAILLIIIGFITALTVAATILQSPEAMAGVIVVTAALVAILFTLRETLPTILETVADFINATAPVLIEVLNTIGSVINSILNTLATTFVTVMDSVSSTIKRIGDTILNVVGGFGPAVEKSVNAIIRALKKLIKFIKSIPLIGDIIELGSAAVEKFRSFVGFANGGYPTEGDIFFANEAGPELIGTIGGRPAVASNNEITGITSAVYDTAAQQNSLLSQQNELLMQILAKTGVSLDGKALRTSINKANRDSGANIGTGGIVFG